MTRKTWFSAIPERHSYRHGMLYFHPVCLVSSDNNSLRRYVPSKRHRSFRYQTLDFSWNHRWILVNSIEVNIGHQMEIRAPLYAENCTLSKSLEDDSMTLSSSHLKTAKTSKLSILFRLRTRCLVSLLCKFQVTFETILTYSRNWGSWLLPEVQILRYEFFPKQKNRKKIGSSKKSQKNRRKIAKKSRKNRKKIANFQTSKKSQKNRKKIAKKSQKKSQKNREKIAKKSLFSKFWTHQMFQKARFYVKQTNGLYVIVAVELYVSSKTFRVLSWTFYEILYILDSLSCFTSNSMDIHLLQILSTQKDYKSIALQ